MSYQALARQWRPKNFESFVGQAPVVQALKQALSREQVHHAYLFTGTRGVGKTTIARLLAKCLNCEQGISAQPCGTCQTCQSIDAGQFVDLIEVDAASKTRVEDTRQLLDNVPYSPVQGRFKIYLIDEVHMLSMHSFNALLKTLEEPPAHVKFLLATTEAHKLPATILSRCIHWSLKPISEADIQAHLEMILSQKKQAFESEAVTVLAQAAKGSLRDALTLLDQALAYCPDTMTESGVQRLLGGLSLNQRQSIVQQVIRGDFAATRELVGNCLTQGVDAFRLIEALTDQVHHWLVEQALEQTESWPDDLKAVSAQQWQLYYDLLIRSRQQWSDAPSPVAALEVALLRLCTFSPAAFSQESSPPVPVGGRSQSSVVSSSEPKSAAPMSKTSAPTIQTPSQPDVSALDPKTQWQEVVAQLPAQGLLKLILEHAWPEDITAQRWVLSLDDSHQLYATPARETELSDLISQARGQRIQVVLKVKSHDVAQPTVAHQKAKKSAQALDEAKKTMQQDEGLASLIAAFDATIEDIRVSQGKS